MFELYSRRNRNIEDDPDVYFYNQFEDIIRNQLWLLIDDVLYPSYSNAYTSFVNFVKIELGKLHLVDYEMSNKREELKEYWFQCNSEDFLDLLDACIYFILNINLYVPSHNISYGVILSLGEKVNFRLKQNNLGYEVIEDKVIRIDNELVHSEIVKPTLLFLHDKNFKGAEEEMYEAFNFLKSNNYKDTIFYAEKAFESTMKTICEIQKYPYEPKKNNAKDLINILIENGYIPSYMSTHFHAVRSALESGLPTLRNKESGHGQGEKVKVVPESYAKYALNLACTNILFLADLI